MPRAKLTRLALSLLLGLAAPSVASAQGVFETPDTFRVNFSWQFASIDTEARLARKGGLSASVGLNFEDVFDIPVQEQAWTFNGSWRMANRHILDVGYMKIDRTGERRIDRDISWGDLTISGNATVQASFASSFPYAGYRYGFYEGGDLEMSIGGGVSYLTIDMGLKASGTVTNSMTGAVSTGGEKSGSFSFPVPLLAFQIDGRITKDWFMTGYVRPVFISNSDYKGGMNVIGISGNWFPSRHWGMGVGFERTLIDVQRVTSGDYEARFKYNISGITASAVVRF